MGELEWKQVGLAGEALTDIEVLPGGPNLVMVGAGNGAWTSRFEYTQWQKQNPKLQPGAQVGNVAIGSSEVLYFTNHTGCASGLLSTRSHTIDGGKTWTEMPGESLYIAAANATVAYGATCRGITKTTNGGGYWDTLDNSRVPNLDPSDIAVSPDGNTLYVAYVSEGGSGSIMYSADGGAKWQDITPDVGPDDTLQAPGDLTYVSGSIGRPDDGGLYMTSAQGIWYLPLESASGWKLMKKEGASSDPSAVQPYYHTAFTVDTAYSEEYEKPGPILYEARETFDDAGAKNLGVFRSTNMGVTWESVGNGLGSRRVWGLALAPHDPATNPGMMETLLAATDDGVWALSIPPSR